jgi:hypothetical protein
MPHRRRCGRSTGSGHEAMAIIKNSLSLRARSKKQRPVPKAKVVPDPNAKLNRSNDKGCSGATTRNKSRREAIALVGADGATTCNKSRSEAIALVGADGATTRNKSRREAIALVGVDGATTRNKSRGVALALVGADGATTCNQSSR